MGPQHRRHSAGGDPAAGGEARCDPTRRGCICRAPPAAVAQLLRVTLADRRNLAGQPTGRGADNRPRERRRQSADPTGRRDGRLAAARSGELCVPNGARRWSRARCGDVGCDREGPGLRADRVASAGFRRGARRRVLHLTKTGDLTMIARSAALGDRSSLAIRLHRAINVLDRFPLSVLQLMLRVAIAAVFWSSGLSKIASWQTTILLFRDEYMVPLLPPEIAAVLSATFELSCSVLIVVGLATRLATLPLLGMTFVIEVFVYPEYWTQHLMWVSVLLFLLTKGAGVFSLDHCAARLLGAREILV